MTPHATWIAVARFGGCGSRSARPLPTVAKVDLARFMGDGYVIGVISTFLEREAYSAVENYATADSRTPTMPEPEYASLVEQLGDWGY